MLRNTNPAGTTAEVGRTPAVSIAPGRSVTGGWYAHLSPRRPARVCVGLNWDVLTEVMS